MIARRVVVALLLRCFGVAQLQALLRQRDHDIRLAEAPSFGKPIVVYDVASVGAQAYMAVAKEIIIQRDNRLK